MANEITITATLAATNPFAVPVSHSASGKQFSMAAGAGDNDVYKRTEASVTTTYTEVLKEASVPITFAKKPVIFLTNRCPTDASPLMYLIVTLDNGTTIHSKIPPQGTIIIWADPAGTQDSFKAKWDSATTGNNIYEVTAVETDV